MKKIYNLLLVIFVTANYLTAQVVPSNLDSALIACYPFTGNAFDATGNGNNGTVNGAVLVNDRFGNPNAAYSFNGANQNVLIPAFNTKITSNEFSISFWATSTLYATRSAFLLAPDDAYNRLNIHIYYGNMISNSQTFFDWGSIYTTGRLYVAGSPLPAASSWDHWVFSNSVVSNTMKCYKNGVLIYTKPASGIFSSATTNRDLLIGGGIGTGSSYLWFSGSLDDIRIYGRELNQADVTALYSQPVKCSDMIPTAIKGNALGLNYNVYPNPVNSSFKINGVGADKTEITLSTVSGAVVKKMTTEVNEAEVNVSDLANGIYILTIKNSKGTQSQKIVKE